MESKNVKRRARARRVRHNISGTSSVPRVSVFRSLTKFYAQAIDDVNGVTIVSASSYDLKDGGNNMESVSEIASVFADRLKSANLDKIVFDRNGYKYHGKVKTFADKLRENGINF